MGEHGARGYAFFARPEAHGIYAFTPTVTPFLRTELRSVSIGPDLSFA
jgi:hypothetical protein